MIKDMRHRIIIESPIYTDDGQGGRDITWAEYAVVWAQAVPLAKWTKEEDQAERTVMVTRYEITIRDLPGLDSSMRILFKGRYLQIKSVVRFDNERRFFMNVMAEDKAGS